jgi:hypothetical protein
MTKMLDFVDKTLDQMPFTIQPSVIITLGFGALMGWDHGLCLMVNNKGDEFLRGVATVSNDMLRSQVIDQRLRLRNVMAFTTCQMKPQRITQGIRRYMNLRTESTPTSSQRLFSLSTVFLSAPGAHG